MKALLRFVWFPAVVTAVVFFWWRLDAVFGWRGVRAPVGGGLLLLAGAALTLGSVGLWFALLTFLLFITSFVPFYEERDMERRFGEEYRRYCRRVPRWWPRLR